MVLSTNEMKGIRYRHSFAVSGSNLI